jgi:hypothetical protein
MPRARRYAIEIVDASGSIVFSSKACWRDKDKRRAIAAIMRLAALPDVNFSAKPELQPETAKSSRPRRAAFRPHR